MFVIVMLLHPKLDHWNTYSQFSTTANKSSLPNKA
jgi:hypothetical protein